MRKLAVVLFLNIPWAFGAGGEGSVWDLKWPFVNLVILATVIAWKARKPLGEVFGKNFSDVEYLYGIAEKKEKESNIKHDMYRNKIEGVDKECDDVLKKFQKKGIDFANEHKRAGDGLIEKLRQEKDKRVEVEKKKMLKEMENALMTDIILKTRKRIAQEQQLKSQVTKGLLSKIG